MTDLLLPPPRPNGHAKTEEAEGADLELKAQRGVYLNRYPRGDVENFSLARAAYALGQQKAGKGYAWDRYAPWEKAFLAARAEDPEFKAQGEAVATQDGAALAPEIWSDRWFGLLRSFSALDQLPVTRVNVDVRIVHLPKVTGDITVVYPGENATVTSSQFQFGQLSYTARKAAGLINVSSELMRDAPGIADQILRRESAKAIAIDRDKQAFIGQGGPNPTGLVYLPQVTTLTPAADAGNGATPTYKDAITFKVAVEQLNNSSLVPAGQAVCDGIVANLRFINTTIYTSAGWQDAQQRPIWMGALKGLFGVDNWIPVGSAVIPINVVKGTSNDTSYIVAGSWANYVLFESLQLGYDATEHGQGFANYQTQVRIVHRYDCGPAHPEAFMVMAGVRG